MSFLNGNLAAPVLKGALVTAVALAASLALAAPAGATITWTQITKPTASPSYFVYNANKDSLFALAGRTNASASNSDTVDIRCFYGDNGQSLLVQSGVKVRRGTFSVPGAPLSVVTDHECRLAALPSGQTTLEPSYTGPWIDVSQRSTSRISGGPNNGKPYDFYAWGQQTALANDFYSLSSCGLCDSYVLDGTGGQTSTVFYLNAYLGLYSEPTRSNIQVDGRDAYAAYSAQSVFGRSGSSCTSTPPYTGCDGSQDNPGFPTFSYRFSQNSSSGNVTITETDEIVRCAGSPTFPPNHTTCPSFKPTGVEVQRKMVQSASGHVVSVTDSFTSTNGAAHKLDLLYENDQCLSSGTCNYTRVGYRFPGESAYAAHAPGDVVRVPAGIGSIYVKILGAADGYPYTGQGAITYSRRPTPNVFLPNPGDGRSDFTMHYANKVPANGTLTYGFVYSTALTYAQVHRYALAAEKSLK